MTVCVAMCSRSGAPLGRQLSGHLGVRRGGPTQTIRRLPTSTQWRRSSESTRWRSSSAHRSERSKSCSNQAGFGEFLVPLSRHQSSYFRTQPKALPSKQFDATPQQRGAYTEGRASANNVHAGCEAGADDNFPHRPNSHDVCDVIDRCSRDARWWWWLPHHTRWCDRLRQGQ